MKLTLIGTLMVVGFLSASCTRPAGNSKLSIQLPGENITQIKSSAVQKSDFTTLSTNDGPPWDSSIKASNLDGIKCYGVAVGGKDDFMQSNSCNLTDGTDVKFGVLVAAIPQGQRIELDVPSGPGRKIALLGFAASSEAECKDLFHSDSINISAPYVLAVKEADLSPGSQTVEFELKAASLDPLFSADTLAQVEGCQGPMIGDPNGGSDGNTSVMQVFGSGVDGDLDVTTGIDFSLHEKLDENSVNRILSASKRILDMSDDRKVLTLNSSFDDRHFIVGDEVLWIVNAASASGVGPDDACGGGLYRGSYGFAYVDEVNGAGSQLRLDREIGDPSVVFDATHRARWTQADTWDANFCRLQLVRVPNFRNITFSTGSFIEPKPYDNNDGGILVFRVSDTMANNYGATAYLKVYGKGFYGAFGGSGGSAHGIQGYMNSGYSSQATGGGSNTESGGGGANQHFGGDGGGASGGIGALAPGLCGGPCMPDEKIFFGGGGGGASSSVAGGNGGGMILTFIKNVTGNGNISYDAYGMGGSDDGANGSGGGAGGTIVSHVGNINLGTHTLTLAANGAAGGVPSSGSGGGGGSGGIVNYHYCAKDAGSSVNAYAWNGGGGGSTPNPGADGESGVVEANPNSTYMCNQL